METGSTRSTGSTGSVLMLMAAVGVATVVARGQALPSSYRETIPGTVVSFEMVLVPGEDGRPPLYWGRTEVTWDLYDVFALGLDEPASRPAGLDAIGQPSNPYGAPDYGWGHAGYPAISVARPAAEAFTKWLSLKTGREYRLPTEEEWQHVARRAWTGKTADDIAWHAGNAGMVTHPVGRKAPDALGLFDLFGNAGEWVTAANDAAVLRGGTFRTTADLLGPDARAVQDDTWNERDPQLPKSRWWLSDGPFAGLRVISGVQGPRVQGPGSGH